MKSVILLVFVTLSFSFSVYSFTDKLENAYIDEPSQELVIGTPNFNMKRYDDFIKTVTSVNGIRNIEYCSGAEVFLIQFDNSVFRSSEEAFKAVEEKVTMIQFQIFHKIGASHAALKANC